MPICQVMVLALHELEGMYAYSRSERSIFHDLIKATNHPIEVKFPSERLMNGSLSASFHLKVPITAHHPLIYVAQPICPSPSSPSILKHVANPRCTTAFPHLGKVPLTTGVWNAWTLSCVMKFSNMATRMHRHMNHVNNMNHIYHIFTYHCNCSFDS